MGEVPQFWLVTGSVVKRAIGNLQVNLVSLVREVYETHASGMTVNPQSVFLRFPHIQNARMIALPAYLGGHFDIAGMKWIGSFPNNTSCNVPRASAVIVLNDVQTGYPIACLEASIISAARTAASASLAAQFLHVSHRAARRIAIIGAGLIARYVLESLLANGWCIGEIVVDDLNLTSAKAFKEYFDKRSNCIISIANSSISAIAGADLILLATTAAKPHLNSPSILEDQPTILNISLRDLAPELILASQNIVDDIDHCLRAETSPHLAEMVAGNRAFVTGTIADVTRGRVRRDPKRSCIFSPFGMGILDIAVAHQVFTYAREHSLATPIDGFFSEAERW